MRLCVASFGALLTYDGERFDSVAAAWRISDAFAESTAAGISAHQNAAG